MDSELFNTAASQDGSEITIFSTVDQKYRHSDAEKSSAQYRAEHAGYQKVCIFMGQDVTSLALVNELIPRLRRLNFEPIVFSVTPNPSHKDEAKHPQLRLIKECQELPIEDVILPKLLDEKREVSRLWKDRSNDFKVVPLALFDQVHKVMPYEVPEYGVRNLDFKQAIEADDKIVGAISVRPYQIFQEPLIQAFKGKNFSRRNGGESSIEIPGFFVNLHPGPLPKMRGIYTPLHAMAQFKTDFAWSIHDVDTGIDTGDIIKRVFERIDYNKHSLALYTDFTASVASALEQELAQLLQTGRFGSVDNQATLIAEKDIDPVYFSYPEAVNVLERDWTDLSSRLSAYNAGLQGSDKLTFEEEGQECVIWDPGQLADYYAEKFGAGDDYLTKSIRTRVYAKLLQINQNMMRVIAANENYTPGDESKPERALS